MTRTVTLERFVRAAPEDAYRAFTNATALREFLCDAATLKPRLGGRLYAAWDTGYYAAGEYTALEENRRVAFSWMGRGAPGPSQVEVTFTLGAGGTSVRVAQAGFGEGPAWDAALEQAREGWQRGLENLASVLETGEDLRVSLRPMMGVFYGEFTPETAARLGVPVAAGVCLGGVMPGMGAEGAGLAKDDVLVQLGGAPLADWADLTPALSRCRAGDVVEVVAYRGAQRLVLPMKLVKRPLPAVPASAAELAAQVQARLSAGLAELDAALAGVSEREAAFSPAPDGWSVCQVLAHLILGARYELFYIEQLLTSQEHLIDDFGGNSLPPLAALLAVYPSLAELRAEFGRCLRAVPAALAALPADFPARRRASFTRLAYNYLQDDNHMRDHAAQVAAAVAAARQA